VSSTKILDSCTLPARTAKGKCRSARQTGEQGQRVFQALLIRSQRYRIQSPCPLIGFACATSLRPASTKRASVAPRQIAAGQAHLLFLVETALPRRGSCDQPTTNVLRARGLGQKYDPHSSPSSGGGIPQATLSCRLN